MLYIKYFILLVSLMVAISSDSTWWIILQSICIGLLVIADLLFVKGEKLIDQENRYRYERQQQQIQQIKLRELNPHKWGKKL